MTTLIMQKNDEVLTTIGSYNTSKAYKQLTTQNVIDQALTHGFTFQGSSAVKVKKKEKAGYQKHLAILEHSNFSFEDRNLQLLIQNSHDKTSSLQFKIGIFEKVCANGIVVGTTFFEYRIPHVGNDFYNKVYEGLVLAIKRMGELKEKINSMSQVILDENKILELKTKVIELR
jgi:hypothetical protein